ncbi:MAG: SPOR domain-containing protein, partial [Spirochaetaceae bacterium]|nr:SPOR domain-containing protein [Spirochaetaceae bacterium]
MEKKKLLLVAVSVGVFLVIVIGASILIVTPQTASPREAAVSPPVSAAVSSVGREEQGRQPVSVDAADMVKNSEDVQGLQTPPSTATAIQENVFYIYGENPNQTVRTAPPEGKTEDQVVIDIPKPSTAAVPDTPAPAARTAAVPERRQTPPAPAPRRTTPAASTKPAPVPQTRVYDDYWVQTGS